ncbi:universal stress protein [Nocardia thailandica]|uniref:universal stress protein n=1 Tax=Nocardia thailandica TaxID=257275 RepID=UPI0002EEB16C|nr:universal stress protein [Nocardia thailandica]
MNASSPHDRADLVSAPILVGVDGSRHGREAVRWAAHTASARRRPIRLLHALDVAASQAVFGPFDLFVPSVTIAMRAHATAYLDAARKLVTEIDPELTVDIEQTDESPAHALVEQSAYAHMTVIGGGGAGGILDHLGSTLLAVTAHAHGVLTVVRDRGVGEHGARTAGPVVVGVDGSEPGRAATEVAFAEASLRGVPLIALHCWTDLRFEQVAGVPDVLDDPVAVTESEELLAEQLAGWQEKYPDVQVSRRIYRHGPAHHLVEWSQFAQLLVAGHRGRGGFRGLLLGSTGNALVQHAHCPVMIVHPS